MLAEYSIDIEHPFENAELRIVLYDGHDPLDTGTPSRMCGSIRCSVPTRPTRVRIELAALDNAPPAEPEARWYVEHLMTDKDWSQERSIRLYVVLLEHDIVLVPDRPQRSGRFLFGEHVKTADRIAYVAPSPDSKICEVFDAQTQLPIGPQAQATYGQIMALAGDHVAFFDERSADDLNGSWPKKLIASQRNKKAEWLFLNDKQQAWINTISTQQPDSVIGNAHKWDFAYHLAWNNYCHFAPQLGEELLAERLDLDARKSDPLTCYLYYHTRALECALVGHCSQDQTTLLQALALDAFGAHFLTDLFATGHMRVPRRHLGTLPFPIGAIRSALMHGAENKHGLLVTTLVPQATVWHWRAYGDHCLYSTSPDGKREKTIHAYVVEESVRRSAQEILAVWRRGRSCQLRHPYPHALNADPRTTADEQIHPQSAEALIPRLWNGKLPPGAGIRWLEFQFEDWPGIPKDENPSPRFRCP
jgi:hypothetical protein